MDGLHSLTSLGVEKKPDGLPTQIDFIRSGKQTYGLHTRACSGLFPLNIPVYILVYEFRDTYLSCSC